MGNKINNEQLSEISGGGTIRKKQPLIIWSSVVVIIYELLIFFYVTVQDKKELDRIMKLLMQATPEDAIKLIQELKIPDDVKQKIISIIKEYSNNQVV